MKYQLMSEYFHYEVQQKWYETKWIPGNSTKYQLILEEHIRRDCLTHYTTIACNNYCNVIIKS